MPQLPKPQRRTGAEEEAPFIRRQVTPTIEGRGLEALGRGVTQAALVVGNLQKRFQDNKRTTQAMEVSSLVTDDVVNFSAQALNLEGNDAIGTQEYSEFFNRAVRERVQAAGLDEQEFVPILNQRFEGLNARMISKIAGHQIGQQEAAARASINQSIQNARSMALLDPENFEDIIADTERDIAALEDIVGVLEAKELKQEAGNTVRETIIEEMAGRDTETARKLLKAFRKDMPEERHDLLEKEITRQEKQAKQDAKDAQIAETNTFMNEFIKREISGDSMTVFEVEASNLEPKQKQTLIDRTTKAPGKFDITDPAAYADLSSAIAQAPETVTQADIYDKLGLGKDGGISTSDAEKLNRMLEGSKEDNPQKVNIASSKKVINDLFTGGVFGNKKKPEAINERAKQHRTLDDWIRDNPGEDPLPFVEVMTTESKEGFFRTSWDIVRHPVMFGRELAATEGPPKNRRLAIEALLDAGQDMTEANIIDAVNQLEDAGIIK